MREPFKNPKISQPIPELEAGGAEPRLPPTPLISEGTYQLYLTVIYPTQVQLPAVSSAICHPDKNHNGHT